MSRGYVSDRSGLVVTSYTAIRGAEAIRLTAPGRVTSNSALVAAYDVARDVAVLQVDGFGSFFQPFEPAAAQANAWQLGFPDCNSGADARRLAIDSVDLSTGTFVLSDAIDPSRIGGAVITRDGRLFGLANQVSGGIDAASINPFLDRAEAAADVVSVRAVAGRQRHLFGSVTLSSGVAGAQVAIEPTQANQWPSLAQTVDLPFTFLGPQGSYRAELIVGGQTSSTTFFRVQPGLATSQILSPTVARVGPGRAEGAQRPPGAEIEEAGGGGFPIAILLVGAIGAGAAAFLLGGGGGAPPTTTTGGGRTTGTVTIFVPTTP